MGRLVEVMGGSVERVGRFRWWVVRIGVGVVGGVKGRCEERR